ncbi:unnamed protein product, partial [Closterium sp. Naga37s-1]
MTSRTALLSAAAACRQQRNLRHLLSAAPFSSAAAPPLLRPSSPSPTSPAAAASPAPATGSSSAHCAASASPAGFPFVPSRLAIVTAEKDFSVADLVIQESTRPKEPLSLRALKFGSQLSEHMLLVPHPFPHLQS